MTDSKLEKTLIVFFRITMGWVFLYAASHQLFDPKFSAGGFLGHTKTFHDFFAYFATPAMLPVTDFLVEWGHFLIGLSLLNFPGKRRLERRFVRTRAVFRGVNGLRSRFHRPPLEID